MPGISEKEVSFSDQEHLILGEINATVKMLPPRMDRFETQMLSSISDLRIEFQTSYLGLNQRVSMLEQKEARHAGVSGTLLWLVGLISAFMGSMVSGVITFFLGIRH